MYSSNPSSFQTSQSDFPSHRTTHIQENTLSPQILLKTPILLSSHQNPHRFIKKHPKFLRKIIQSDPQDQESHHHHHIFSSERNSHNERLKNNAKLLQDAKTITHLSHSFMTTTPFDLSYSLSQLKYLQNISTLDLKIPNERHLTPPNIQILSQIIFSLKTLRTFSFEAPLNFILSSELIEAIFHAFKTLKLLSHLSFKFDSPLQFGDLQIEHLALHLSQFPQLKGLKLCLQKAHKVTITGLQSLAQTFSRLPLLSEVSLKLLSFCSCSISTFHKLFSGLVTCESLKKLEIDLKPDFDYRNYDPYQTEPLSSGLKLLNSSSLREISLQLYQIFTDYGLNQLSKALTRFSSLRTLKIDFSNGPSISDESLSHFSSALQTFTSLSTLSLLSLGNCRGLQTSIELISQGIAPLTQLRNLSLGFEFCQGQKFYSILALSASLKGLKLLKQLDLNLSSLNFLDDEGVALLAEGLGELTDLTNLVIDLRSIENITNQSIKSLVSSFSNFSKLAYFTLKLDSKRIDGDAFSIFANGLGSLPAFYSLNFVCSHIKESNYKQGFEDLCEALKNSVSLRKIYLEANKKFLNPNSHVQELERVKSARINWVWPPVQVEKRVFIERRSFLSFKRK